MARSRATTVLTSWRLMLMLIAGGVMALIVVAVIGFSSALYTSQSTSPGNIFSAGSIDLRLANTGQLLDAQGLLPGDSRTGQQTVTNVEHKATVSLAASNVPAGNALAAVLRVTVHQTDPAREQPLWSGTLADLAQVSLGTFAAGERRSYRLELGWPAAATDPALQGAAVSFGFTWTAESVP